MRKISKNNLIKLNKFLNEIEKKKEPVKDKKEVIKNDKDNNN